MNPIPSYLVIEFLEWLRLRDIELTRLLDSRECIRGLVEEYLKSSGDILTNVLKLFQICPMISEDTIQKQMKHFSHCGSCIEHWKMVSLQNVEIHPFLIEFRKFLVSRKVDWRYSRSTPEILFRNRRFDSGGTDWFHIWISENGGTLYEAFTIFIKDCDHKLISSFEWIRRNRDFRSSPWSRSEYGEDFRGEIDIERFVESIWGALHSELYRNEPTVIECIMALAQHDFDLMIALDFFEWLRNFDGRANMSVVDLQEKFSEFCALKKVKNPVLAWKEMKLWLKGKLENKANDVLRQLGAIDVKLEGLLSRFIAKLVSQDVPEDIFTRYFKIRFHGVFLFQAYQKEEFRKFIRAYWIDLNARSGDICDIYYTLEDLECRVPSVPLEKWFKEKGVEIDSSYLPGICIWKDTLDEAIFLSLYNIKNEDIYRFLSHIIENTMSKDVPVTEIKVRYLKYFSNFPNFNSLCVKLSRIPLVRGLANHFNDTELKLIAKDLLGENESSVGGTSRFEYAANLVFAVEMRSDLENLKQTAHSLNPKFLV